MRIEFAALVIGIVGAALLGACSHVRTLDTANVPSVSWAATRR